MKVSDAMKESVWPRKRSVKRRLSLLALVMLVADALSSTTCAVQGLSLPRKRSHLYRSRKAIVSSDGGSLCCIRGGAPSRTARSASFSSDDSIPPSNTTTKVTRRERGMAIALFSTYFCVMGAKCALPSVLSLLLNPETGLDFSGWTGASPQQLFSRQLFIATLAVALGKLLLGPVIDAVGGIASLQVALTTLSLLLATIASCHRFLTFAIAWIGVDFIFSSCWAACISAIHSCFPQEEWAGRVGMLAAAARTGNAAAFAAFASVLQWTSSNKSQSWRVVFWVSSLIQLVPISLLTYFGRFYQNDTLEQLDKDDLVGRPSFRTSVACLKREATTPEFWLHFASRSALMVFGSFLLFVPTLMTNCYGATSAFGAQVGSIFALGCLLSVTFGSQLYATLSKRRKIQAIIALLGSATLTALAQLAHVKGILSLSASSGAFSMFLWGLCFAIPFYIPPSLYALSRGGKASATIADVFDFGGFALLALFNGYVASIQHSVLSAWVPTFEILTGCSILSLLSLSLAIYYE